MHQSQVINRQTQVIYDQRNLLVRAAALIHAEPCGCYNADFGEWICSDPCARCEWLDAVAKFGIDPRRGVGMGGVA